MATILFYEKPGCANNARQKRLLLDAGHELIVCDLLATRWTAEELRAFFGGRPVSEWFNRAAPRVKPCQRVHQSTTTRSTPRAVARPEAAGRGRSRWRA